MVPLVVVCIDIFIDCYVKCYIALTCICFQFHNYDYFFLVYQISIIV